MQNASDTKNWSLTYKFCIYVQNLFIEIRVNVLVSKGIEAK